MRLHELLQKVPDPECSKYQVWSEILSPPHHLSQDGATTSTPSYLMLAGPWEPAPLTPSYLIQLVRPTLR